MTSPPSTASAPSGSAGSSSAAARPARSRPVAQRHGPTPGWAEHAERIAEAVRERPDATLEEHRAGLGLALSTSTLWRAIKALGLTRQKKVLRAAEQDRPDVARGAAAWRAAMPGAGPRPPGLRRRDLGEHEHDPPLRPQPQRRAAGDAGAARPLEDDHVRRRRCGPTA